MTIQDRLDDRLAELEYEVKRRLGARFVVSAEFKRTAGGAWSHTIWTYSDWLAKDIVLLASGHASLDETFDAAFARLATMRTAQDELGDLYAGLDLPQRSAA